MFLLIFSRAHTSTPMLLGPTLTFCQEKPTLKIVGHVGGVVRGVEDKGAGFCLFLFVLK